MSADYDVRDHAFSGEVNWVQIDAGKEDYHHLISPEERLNFGVARQLWYYDIIDIPCAWDMPGRRVSPPLG